MAPWALSKDESKKDILNMVLYNLSESLRIVSILIYPFMHYSSTEIRKQLSLSAEDVKWVDALVFDKEDSYKMVKGVQLFPRIDVKEELEKLTEINPGGNLKKSR
jgi:methionyl-tRNA synthetase